MREIIMLKLGEIILKGQNRYRFEDLLMKNVRTALRGFGRVRTTSAQSTIYVTFDDENADITAAVAELQKVFGIIALTRAYEGSYDFETLKQETLDYLSAELAMARTFKVEARRADKRYGLNSPQICAQLGEFLLEHNPHLTVDVHQPELTVYAEVREGHIYVHADPIRGAGGLPAGTSGHGLLMLSGGIDSPVAGYMMAKRGLKISAIHFESPPYTSERAKQKVIALAKKLSIYTLEVTLYTVHFTEMQEKIKDLCKEELFTIIMRRQMLKIACPLAEQIGAKALITGENLGQVASQTTGAICCTEPASDRPIFRPLIGMDKQEIINIARNIDTYEMSIQPYEDCCTVFTPKHPKTNPVLAEVLAEEEKLPADIPYTVEKTVITPATEEGLIL